ncbi:hypothetical protein L1887_55079 [Cichorium endivia]|nr:hypothetical protein L1887_55079 [Cichorium endivia]
MRTSLRRPLPAAHRKASFWRPGDIGERERERDGDETACRDGNPGANSARTLGPCRCLPLLPTASKARSTLARLDAGGKREKKGWSSLLAVAATHWRSRCLMATDALFNALFGTRRRQPARLALATAARFRVRFICTRRRRSQPPQITTLPRHSIIAHLPLLPFARFPPSLLWSPSHLAPVSRVSSSASAPACPSSHHIPAAITLPPSLIDSAFVTVPPTIAAKHLHHHHHHVGYVYVTTITSPSTPPLTHTSPCLAITASPPAASRRTSNTSLPRPTARAATRRLSPTPPRSISSTTTATSNGRHSSSADEDDDDDDDSKPAHAQLDRIKQASPTSLPQQLPPPAPRPNRTESICSRPKTTQTSTAFADPAAPAESPTPDLNDDDEADSDDQAAGPVSSRRRHLVKGGRASIRSSIHASDDDQDANDNGNDESDDADR